MVSKLAQRAAASLPWQGQADAEGLKQDLGHTPVPSVPSSAHPAPLGPQRMTPGFQGRSSLYLPALAAGPKNVLPTAGSGRQRLGVGAANPRAQAADMASARRRPRAPSPLQHGSWGRGLQLRSWGEI